MLDAIASGKARAPSPHDAAPLPLRPVSGRRSTACTGCGITHFCEIHITTFFTGVSPMHCIGRLEPFQPAYAVHREDACSNCAHVKQIKNCSCTPAIRDATLGLMQARKGGVRASPYAMQRVCGGGRQGRRHRRELWALCGGIRRRLAGLAGMGERQPSAGGYPALGNDVWITVRPAGRTLQMERYGTVYRP